MLNMRRPYILSALVCLLLALPACSPEQTAAEQLPDDSAGAGVPMTFEARSEVPEARLVLDYPSVLWSDSDAIAVFDGSARNVFTISEGGNGGTSARFSGSVTSGSGEFWAVSPESAGVSLESGALCVNLPSVQRLKAGESCASGALVSVARADGDKLLFRNVTALLKFTLESDGITSVVLKGDKITGEAVVGTDGVMSRFTDASDDLTLLPEDGTFAPGTYFAAVYPGSHAYGTFTVTLTRNDGLTGTRSASGKVVFERNCGTDAGVPEAHVSWERLIMNKQQLFQWNESRDPSDASDRPRLGADIDMEMDPWTPRNFAGVFDGQGHRIYNLNAVSTGYVGFLREMTGSAVLKDLVVGSSDGSNYDGSSVIRHSKSANNYTWYYAGVAAKVSGSSTVTRVTNFATVEVASDATSKTRIGGLVGNWNSSSECTGLVNYGTVRNLAKLTGQASSSDATLSSSLVGGVLGFFDVRTTISDCHNHGTVRTTNPGVSAVGGVVGYDGRGSTIRACSNYGAVSHEASSDIVAESAAAGIIAYAIGTSSAFGAVSDCVNEGPVSASCGGKNFRLSGISGYTQYYTVGECFNRGDIRFNGNTASAGFLAIGGVVAHTYSGCVVSGCRNEGAVSSNRRQVNRIGGIMGNLNGSAIRSCSNAGPVTLDNSAAAISNWQGAGGIVGFSEGASGVREISDCVNEAGGVVSVTVNTVGHDDYHRCCAGGILGMPYTAMTIAGNVNRADVTMQNKHSSAPYVYVGGIFGQDRGAASASSVQSNTNYGTVRNISGRSGYCGAGGLFGNLALASSVSGNCNFGSVEGTVAGAVAGIDACTFTATVCDALTVNGLAYGTAGNKNDWACPGSAGKITLVVTPHSDGEDGSLRKPLEPGNKVVAHRGGATESGYPDNSRAALRYAMGLGCYGSECDIYWTKDNEVIVAHADSECKVNGLHPWESTAADIIAAKRLSNYERVPTLGEYIDIVMESGSRTKLLLDIKMITAPTMNYDYPAKAALRAIEIVQEKGAQNFVEFICTGYEQVMKQIAEPMKAAGLACGWMNGGITASSFKSKGYTDWANLNAREHFKMGSGEDKSTGSRTIQEFKNAGLQLSIFHLDKQSGNSSAVYTEANVQLFLNEYSYLRCITTNYPSWLLQRTKGL